MPKITQQKKDAIRVDILNAARVVFKEKGYEAASMKDIVISSGRSFGGVYLYYSNKEEIFLELLRRQYEDMALEIKLEQSAWRTFVQFMSAQEGRVREVDSGLAPSMYEYFIVGRREENRRKLIKERYEGVYRSIAALIDDGIQRGELHPSQPVDIFVHWLITFMDGLYFESIVNGVAQMELTKQFELTMTVCRSILRPIEREEYE